jgi:hypothetical protein
MPVRGLVPGIVARIYTLLASFRTSRAMPPDKWLDVTETCSRVLGDELPAPRISADGAS